MRISITDKFLWDAYKFLEEANGITHTTLHRPRLGESFYTLKDPFFAKYRKEKNRREFSNLIYYLKRKGYIKIKNLKGKSAIMLTKEGINKALLASFETADNKKRKDGKWIMLIFDIPSINKKARTLLRSILRNLGYKLFQQSVWITPYDVSDKTEKLIQMHYLDKYVKIFIIEKI